LLSGKTSYYIDLVENEEMVTDLRRHRILPLAESFLGEIEEDREESLKNRLMLWKVRSLHFFETLKELTIKCEKQGISLVHIKGPILSHLLYGDIAQRQYRDLDVLVQKDELILLLDILDSIGFEIEYPRVRPDSKSLAYYFKYRKEIGLIHRESKIHLELHTRIDSNGVIDQHSETILIGGLNRVNVHECQFFVMNNNNAFLYLVFHGSWHMFFRLCWLRDIAEAIKRWDLDHAKILRLASELGIQRMLGISLLFIEEFYAYELPEEYAEYLEKEANVLRKIKSLCNRYIIGPETPNFVVRVERFRYFILLKKGLKHKWRMVSGMIHRVFIRALFD